MCTIDPQTRTYKQCKQCALYDTNWEDDNCRCEKPAAEGSEFCEAHQHLKLCKTTGLEYLFGGTSLFQTKYVMPAHVVGEGRTKRAEFCEGDRCRNLWRDTRRRITRDAEIERVIDGKPSDRYSVIPNFNNSGSTVIYDKKAHRRLS
jgi:hypothetical protein